MSRKRQMKKMGGPVWYRSWRPSKKGLGGWEIDDEVTGTLVDTSIDKKYKRTNYHIKVEEFNFDCENQKGEPLEVGDTLVLNGCGILEKYLEGVQRGEAINVIYKGQAEITSGEWEGEMAINLEVYIEDGGDSAEGGYPSDGNIEEGDLL